MADSLNIAGTIELLSGGVASTTPGTEGAVFYLGREFDLGAPNITTEQVAGMLLDGEQVTAFHAGNRTPTLPVVIRVRPTGDYSADRTTLAAARELLLETAATERWQLTWTRDGGLPVIFDCQFIASVTVNHSIIHQRNLFSLIELTFAASPYVRSDDEETLLFPAPSQTFDQPPSTVTLDNFNTTGSFLTGDDSTFEGSAGDWVAVSNCTVTRSTTQAHAGTASLRLSSTAAGAMTAAHTTTTGGITVPPAMGVQPGDTVHAGCWWRAGATGRSSNIGVDFYDSNGVQIGATLRGSNITSTTTGFLQATASVTAPVPAASCRANVQVLATAAGAELHYCDDVTLDQGPVYSTNAPDNWNPSSVTPIAGGKSAFWSRSKGDAPNYTRVLPAQIDITGRSKLTFWLGLATTSGAYKNWHKGRVQLRITLTDPQGDTITFGAKHVRVQASALQTKPHWQKLSAPVPQNVPSFDYTHIAAYSVQVWNTWNPLRIQPVLQASAYLSLVQATGTGTGTGLTRGAFYEIPGVIGTAPAPIALQATPGPSGFSTVTDFITPGSNNWTCPAGVLKLDKVESVGAGGGGAGGDTPGNNPGGGGGAAEYAMDLNVPVTPTTVYHPVVGLHGTGGTANVTDQTDGGDSWFIGDGSLTTYAHGGFAGFRTGVYGGSKGAYGSNSYLHYPGGDGWQANFFWQNQKRRGGGGGSAGGPSSAGQDASDADGAPAVASSGPGGQGGHFDTVPQAGSSPTSGPGGGGGGGSNDHSGAHNGGDGADGRVRLTYGATGLLPMSSLLVHMPSRDQPAALSPLCPAGGGADPPDAREYIIPAVGALSARFDGSYSLWVCAATYASPSGSHTLTVTVKQYAYTGGPSTSLVLTRQFTPSTDAINGYTEMGVLTLPLWDLPPGNLDSYFSVSILSSNASDRVNDVLLLDTQGQLVFANMAGTAFANNMWIDEAELDRDLGRVLASDADRDRARSVLMSDPSNRASGGPLRVVPGAANRMLVYQGIGLPSVTASYLPRWWADRLQ